MRQYTRRSGLLARQNQVIKQSRYRNQCVDGWVKVLLELES